MPTGNESCTSKSMDCKDSCLTVAVVTIKPRLLAVYYDITGMVKRKKTGISRPFKKSFKIIIDEVLSLEF